MFWWWDWHTQRSGCGKGVITEVEHRTGIRSMTGRVKGWAGHLTKVLCGSFQRFHFFVWISQPHFCFKFSLKEEISCTMYLFCTLLFIFYVDETQNRVRKKLMI